MKKSPAVWFPTVRAGTGTDVFTEQLVAGLVAEGLRAEITWLPLRAEYAPWTVSVPDPPEWANICHVNTWLHARFLPKSLPVVATLHHSIHDPALRPYKGVARAAYHRWWIAPNERRVMRRAQRTVAVSRFVADMARQTLCDVPMDVIHNGIDTRRFTPAQPPHQSGEPFRLLYVGSWMARKGVDLLAPIMRELGEGFALHYTGGGAAASDKPGMPANMYDLGRLAPDAVIRAMQQSDAFLFPTRSEGFGLVAAEAMACGLPVVATQVAALSEIIDSGTDGILCEMEGVDAIASRVLELRNSRELRQVLSRAARAKVLRCFSIDRMVRDYMSLYGDEFSASIKIRG